MHMQDGHENDVGGLPGLWENIYCTPAIVSLNSFATSEHQRRILYIYIYTRPFSSSIIMCLNELRKAINATTKAFINDDG